MCGGERVSVGRQEVRLSPVMLVMRQQPLIQFCNFPQGEYNFQDPYYVVFFIQHPLCFSLASGNLIIRLPLQLYKSLESIMRTTSSQKSVIY